MVDVGAKAETERVATARSRIWLGKTLMGRLQDHELHTAKGPVIQTAIIAGTMAVKRTAELIPFCHPLPINGCDFESQAVDEERLELRCTVRTFGKTGVEMEALTGASVAALTVYDMCKALSSEIAIEDTRLLSKTGGKQDYQHPEA